MAPRDEFVENILDLLRPWGGVAARRMFGGHGLYRQGLMFALVSDDVLYLKVDDRNRPDFTAAGMTPFTYRSRAKTVALSYWEAPSDLFDDPDAMLTWAKSAFDVALRNKKPETSKPRRKITKI